MKFRLQVHYRDLTMEMERLVTLCSQEKEPRDVAEAGVFLEDHDQLKVQIKCWYESFTDLKESGSVIAGVLIEENQVKEKVNHNQPIYPILTRSRDNRNLYNIS